MYGNHMLSFKTAPEEHIENQPHYRKEYQRYNPCQGANWVSILSQYDYYTAYYRNCVSD